MSDTKLFGKIIISLIVIIFVLIIFTFISEDADEEDPLQFRIVTINGYTYYFQGRDGTHGAYMAPTPETLAKCLRGPLKGKERKFTEQERNAIRTITGGQ